MHPVLPRDGLAQFRVPLLGRDDARGDQLQAVEEAGEPLPGAHLHGDAARAVHLVDLAGCLLGMEVRGEVGDDQVAAGGEAGGQLRDQLVRAVLVGEEVEEGVEGEGDGLREVEDPGGLLKDAAGLAGVGLDVAEGAFGGAGEQGLGVGEDDGVVVAVDDAGVGADPLGGLVEVGLGGDAGADVEELADAQPGQPAGGAQGEGPVHAGHDGDDRGERGELPPQFLVGRVVVLASQVPVVQAGGVGLAGVDLRGLRGLRHGVGLRPGSRRGRGAQLAGHQAVLRDLLGEGAVGGRCRAPAGAGDDAGLQQFEAVQDAGEVGGGAGGDGGLGVGVPEGHGLGVGGAAQFQGGVGEGEVAAGGERVDQVADDAAGLGGVGDEVEDAEQHHRDRPGQVQGAGGPGEDGPGVVGVGVQVGGGALGGPGEQRAGVAEDDRVVVDVDDAGAGVDALGDLVGVVDGGQSGADVQELGDARLPGQVRHGPPEEGAVGAGHVPDAGWNPATVSPTSASTA
ncbi:hypothetical protein SF12_02540 [Streptomyces sp. MBRL 601]|nr:hypothetical protein SF12_02540 [Streptomyces sp. MBRL 601]